MTCSNCDAPAEYLYFNDGKKRSQVLCKICGFLSQICKRSRPNQKTKYWCPYCHKALYLWKKRQLETIYKCHNDKCPAYLKAKDKLNAAERHLRKKRSSQFKLRYQYREYHFTPAHLKHSAPDSSKVDLDNIHHTPSVLGLILTFHVSFALAARKTALILKQVFNIKISHQTVLNYAEAAAVYCHRYNLRYKGEIDNHSAGDETYIKIAGKHAFTFFFVSAAMHKITAYHVAHSRDTLPATIAMTEATRTARPDQPIAIITDGNPSYAAGLHFVNEQRQPEKPIQHHKVIGLQNLDDESELYRRFKQMIERLNRTYKYHTRPANGFKSQNGAVAYTTLFVSHYNFLRSHIALAYRVPIPQPDLDRFQLIQEKWCRIIDVGKQINPASIFNQAPVFK